MYSKRLIVPPMNLDSLFCSPVPNATIITESLNHSLEIVGGNFSCVIMFQVCCCISVMKFIVHI